MFGNIDQATRGIIEVILVVTGIALFASVPGVIGEELDITLIELPAASPELLRGIANIGIALVLAFVVQAVSMVREAGSAEDDENWVGFLTGAGIVGFFGMALALLLAEHRAAGHDNAIDAIGSAWVFASQGVLAAIVLTHPLFVYRSKKREGEDG